MSRPHRRRLVATTLAIGLAGVAAGCSADSDSDDAAPTAVRVLFPAESPIEYPVRIADEAGYLESEGLTASFEYAGGSSEVVQQLISGNGDVGVTCTSAIVNSISQGFSEIRPVFTLVYGSIFGIAVPDGSNITDPSQLAGTTIGISDPAGGEVPIVRGILGTAGLTEDDVTLLPIGDATGVVVSALQDETVDAIGGSFSDFVAVEVQGVELETVGGDAILDLPACGVIVTEDYLEDNPDTVEAFLRATAMGVVYGQANPDATLEILRGISPDAYEGDLGARMFELYIPIMDPGDGLVGDIDTGSYEAYFDFVGEELPEGGLEGIIVEDYVEPANDFDRDEIVTDAQG